MLNNSVVSFYENFGLFLTGWITRWLIAWKIGHFWPSHC